MAEKSAVDGLSHCPSAAADPARRLHLKITAYLRKHGNRKRTQEENEHGECDQHDRRSRDDVHVGQWPLELLEQGLRGRVGFMQRIGQK